MSVQQGGGWRIGRQVLPVMKMNGPNGEKIDRPGSGSAKVFARFPIVLISVICSVCYRMRARDAKLRAFLGVSLSPHWNPKYAALPAA
jgi:hypothetical protein